MKPITSQTKITEDGRSYSLVVHYEDGQKDSYPISVDDVPKHMRADIIRNQEIGGHDEENQ